MYIAGKLRVLVMDGCAHQSDGFWPQSESEGPGDGRRGPGGWKRRIGRGCTACMGWAARTYTRDKAFVWAMRRCEIFENKYLCYILQQKDDKQRTNRADPSKVVALVV